MHERCPRIAAGFHAAISRVIETIGVRASTDDGLRCGVEHLIGGENDVMGGETVLMGGTNGLIAGENDLTGGEIGQLTVRTIS